MRITKTQKNGNTKNAKTGEPLWGRYSSESYILATMTKLVEFFIIKRHCLLPRLARQVHVGLFKKTRRWFVKVQLLQLFIGELKRLELLVHFCRIFLINQIPERCGINRDRITLDALTTIISPVGDAFKVGQSIRSIGMPSFSSIQ